VADYYDTYLGPNPKLFYTTRGGEGDIIEIPITWGGGKYRDAHPYFDGYDNVNPHPESQDLGGLGEFWRQVGRPVATAAAMYFGGEALAGMAGDGVAVGAAGEGATTGLGTVGGGIGTASEFAPMSIGQMSAPLSSTELASLSAPSTGAAGATGLLADGNQSAAEVARLGGMNAGDQSRMLSMGTAPGVNTADVGLWDKATGFIKDNPTLAKLAMGALGAAASGDTKTSQSKDPWGPAQPYLLQNLAQNQAMSDYYNKNPFSQEQQNAYQGLLNTVANSQAAGNGLLSMAQNFGQSKRGVMPQFGPLGSAQAPAINWSQYQNIGRK
jgi:hypothetical protein